MDTMPLFGLVSSIEGEEDGRTEEKHHQAKPVVRLHAMPIEKDVARHLEQHKRQEEDPDGGIVAVVRHVQVGFEAVELGVGDVHTVEERGEVEPAEDGDEADVAFPGDSAVQGRIVCVDLYIGIVSILLVQPIHMARRPICKARFNVCRKI